MSMDNPLSLLQIQSISESSSLAYVYEDFERSGDDEPALFQPNSNSSPTEGKFKIKPR